MYRDLSDKELNRPVPEPHMGVSFASLRITEKRSRFMAELGLTPDRLISDDRIEITLNPAFSFECQEVYAAFCYFADELGIRGQIPDVEEYPSVVPGVPRFMAFSAELLEKVSELAPNVVKRMAKLARLAPKEE